MSVTGRDCPIGAYGDTVSLDELVTWLVSPELTDVATGHCLSWSNHEHPGYAYPEISGLLLTLVSRDEGHRTRRAALRRALTRHPGAPQGVGRAGRFYTFDLGMALRGLIREGGTSVGGGPMEVWPDLLIGHVLAGVATDPRVPLDGDTRWSDAFGAHQMKLVGALQALVEVWEGCRSRADDVKRARRGIGELVRRTQALQRPDGRFVVHEKSSLTYLHSHCYAMEGCLMARAAGLGQLDATIHDGAEWLASVQGPDGSFRAEHDGDRSRGPRRGDVAAQAIRIFRLDGEERFHGCIARAVQFLQTLRVPGKGFRYEPESRDVNAWTTIFAAQALAAPAHAWAVGDGLDLV